MEMVELVKAEKVRRCGHEDKNKRMFSAGRGQSTELDIDVEKPLLDASRNAGFLPYLKFAPT